MTLCCNVTGRSAYKVGKAIRKGSTESDSWMMMSLSALKGEATRKREAKGKPEDGNILSASCEKEDVYPLNHSGSLNRHPKVDARLRVVEVIYFGEDVAEWLDEEASWHGTT